MSILARRSRTKAFAAVVALVFAAGCAPNGESEDSSPDKSPVTTDAKACVKDSLALKTKGQLTVGTDSPAYDPWFSNDDPTNGKGFESAVTYAVADELGFAKSDVRWVKVPFNTSYQPGAKTFDFDINQISITAPREKAVTFSDPYYSAAQAIITLKKSRFAKASSLDGFAAAQLGAQVGTTSLQAIDQVSGAKKPRVYDDTNQATKALENGQIDGLVADLPSAYYITSAEIDDAMIVGQFQPETGESEKFGLLFAKGNELVTCVNKAITTLRDDGSLAALEKQWLSQSTGVPTLS